MCLKRHETCLRGCTLAQNHMLESKMSANELLCLWWWSKESPIGKMSTLVYSIIIEIFYLSSGSCALKLGCYISSCTKSWDVLIEHLSNGKSSVFVADCKTEPKLTDCDILIIKLSIFMSILVGPFRVYEFVFVWVFSTVCRAAISIFISVADLTAPLGLWVPVGLRTWTLAFFFNTKTHRHAGALYFKTTVKVWEWLGCAKLILWLV